MLGQWEPTETTKKIQPSTEDLIALADSATSLKKNQISELDESLTSRASQWIKLSESEWQTALKELPEAYMLPLAEFYVHAEMKLTGFDATDKNPAIWVFRWLKSNKRLPAKELIKELKKATNNRFIPYGSALS